MKKLLVALFIIAACTVITGGTVLAKFEYTYDAQEASFTLDCDSTTLNGERVMLMVFEGTEYDINKLVSVKYINSVVSGSKLSFDFALNECSYGPYLLYLAITNNDLTATKIEKTFYYSDPLDVAACFDAFKTSATADEFKSDYALYTMTKPVLNASEIEETITDGVIAKYFMLRALYLEEKGNLEFADTNDVLLCIKGAVLIDAIEKNSNNLENIYSKYSSALGGIYVENADVEKVQQLYEFFKSNIEDENDLYVAIRKSSAFAPAIGGTDQKMIDIINNYGIEFGVDFDYMQEKNITVANAVKYMNFDDNMQSYVLDFATAVKNAVDAAVAASASGTDPGTDTGSDSGTGGGNGGGGITQKPASSNPAAGIKPSDEKEPEKETESEKPVFSDIDKAPWAEQYIKYCSSMGIINGFEDGTFRPNDFVTREQFVKMLVEALDIEIIAEGIDSFPDVISGAWYEPYVRSAYSLDIVKGISDARFGIGENITRQQLVTMLYRAYWIDSTGEVLFADINEISDYAMDAISAYSKAGILSGYEDGTFKPNALATRAEAAAIITKLAEKIKQN